MDALLAIIFGLVSLGIAALVGGVDSREGFVDPRVRPASR